MTRVASIALAIVLLASCASVRHKSDGARKYATGRNSPPFCEVATEMTWAARDSIETQDEIRAFNADWKKFCSPEGSPDGKH